MKPAAIITTLFLSLVAVLHLVRLIVRIEVIVAGFTVPLWMSLAGMLFTGALAVWLWRESRS